MLKVKKGKTAIGFGNIDGLQELRTLLNHLVTLFSIEEDAQQVC